jgi:5-methylcytosine-specific restriction endonuclease McrA
LSEHAAYGRIEAARAARKWPAILELLADGSVHLTAISLLAPHLKTENHQQLLALARHKSKREVEEIVAMLRPLPAAASPVRKLPAPKAPLVDRRAMLAFPTSTASTPTEPAAVAPAPENPKPRAAVTPLAPERYKVQCTVSRETHQKLREAQDLLRRRIPSGDVAAIFDRALTLLLAALQRTRHAATPRPRTPSNAASHIRHIPASVKREVWARDGGQCAFVGAAGRCTERGFLEYHHLVPFAHRGATSVDNLQLRCRAHNAYEAERWFGVREEDLVRERTDAWDASGESSNCLRLQ